MFSPHGGKLINRILKDRDREDILSRIESFPKLDLSSELAFEVENIATGLFSPLEGFLTRADFQSVLKEGRLKNGLPWTIPIVLDIDSGLAQRIKDHLALYYQGEPIAVLMVEEIYGYDRTAMAQSVYGTLDERHPGVIKVKNMKEKLVGGKIGLINPVPARFPQHHLTPEETRSIFESKGWNSVVAFQTRNVPHIGHEYLQKSALTFVDGLFINPVIGKKKKGDYKDEVIIRAYEILIENYYPKENVILNTLQMEMRYAGPKEAIHHAIIRKNYGCTHIIIGRDHAGVGDFYPPYAAHEIFSRYPDLEIMPLFFRSFYYCRKCGSVVNDRICPHGEEYRLNFSGTRIRKAIQSGDALDEAHLLIRPEVEELIRRHPSPFVE